MILFYFYKIWKHNMITKMSLLLPADPRLIQGTGTTNTCSTLSFIYYTIYVYDIYDFHRDYLSDVTTANNLRFDSLRILLETRISGKFSDLSVRNIHAVPTRSFWRVPYSCSSFLLDKWLTRKLCQSCLALWNQFITLNVHACVQVP